MDDKILVVDDAPQNLKLLRVILKDVGYEVIEATSGPEAIQKVAIEKPDAMILDVRMPGMSGYDVSETVRRDPRFATLPIIMLTALAQSDERVRGIQAGATDFITKPFSKKELLARLRTSLMIAKAASSAANMRLPPGTLMVDSQWHLTLTASNVPAMLEVAIEDLESQRLDALLQGQRVDWPHPLPDASWTFKRSGNDWVPLLGTCTPVHDAAGVLQLWVVVLSASAE